MLLVLDLARTAESQPSYHYSCSSWPEALAQFSITQHVSNVPESLASTRLSFADVPPPLESVRVQRDASVTLTILSVESARQILDTRWKSNAPTNAFSK